MANVANSAAVGSSTNTATSVKTNNGQTLGKDAFLKILVTQLQYQDPLQPMNDREFISQMAQFSSLEQMTNVATTNNQLEAFQLLGHTVSVKYNGASDSGVVSSVATNSGSPMLTINGNAYPLSSVVTELN